MDAVPSMYVQQVEQWSKSKHLKKSQVNKAPQMTMKSHYFHPFSIHLCWLNHSFLQWHWPQCTLSSRVTFTRTTVRCVIAVENSSCVTLVTSSITCNVSTPHSQPFPTAHGHVQSARCVLRMWTSMRAIRCQCNNPGQPSVLEPGVVVSWLLM